MIDSIWNGLLANFALVALVVSLWTHSRDWLEGRIGPLRAVAFGLLLGIGAVAMMLLPAQVRPGYFFDLRITPVAIAGYFGGPIAGSVALLMVVGCRILLGGAGIWLGVISVVVAAAIGIAGYQWHRRHPVRRVHLVWLSALAALSSLIGVLLIPPDMMLGALGQLVPLMGLLFVSTLFCGLALLADQRRSDLLQENQAYRALTEALPDCLSSKDLEGRFTTVNSATARFHGVSSSAELIGKTDDDYFPPETAAAFRTDEQAMLATGEPVVLLQPSEENGQIRWMAALVAPMRDPNGKIIGILTHARDVTAQRRLEADASESQKHLNYALEQMSDGLATFDRNGILVFCNEQYRTFFPLTGSMRQPGVHIRQMLRAAVETGEQLGAPQDHGDEWINRIAASLMVAGEEEVHLFDGRWLHVRTRPTEDGSSMVVVSDVTRIKHAETSLLEMTGRLKLLATTDGLTGLLNRRAFDQALEAEVSRSARTRAPLSLLMIDIDRFKAFNDLYGHPAGDECLRVVSRCLNETVQRPADVIARYGGEEFVAILPDTDEDAAFLIADAFREALRDRNLEHAGSEKRVVTASVGIATFAGPERVRRAADLVTRADDALYGAKEAGRDRVNGWRKRYGAEVG